MQKKTHAKDNAMTVNPYSRLVSLPIHSGNIFHFPEGLPAFENSKEFVFLFKAETTPFVYMQALEPADLSFVCVDPFIICPGYAPRLSEADLTFLHLKKPEDLMLLSIVTVAKKVEDTTANLQGPIAINFTASIGKQIICDNQHYPVRYKIWDGIKRFNSEQKSSTEKIVESATAHV